MIQKSSAGGGPVDVSAVGDGARPGGGRLVHVTSPSLERLEEALFEAIRAEKAGDPLAPVAVLAASNFLRYYLSRRLAALAGGHAGVRFLTFNDLARDLGAAEPARRGLAPLPEGGEVRLAAQAAAGLPPDAYYRAIAHRPGFHRSLAATFADLREAGCEAEDFQRVVAGIGAADGAFGDGRAGGGCGGAAAPARLGELAALFAAYRRALRRGHHDTADLFLAAAERATAARLRALYGVERLLVYGFADLSGLQRRLLGALARSASLLAFIPYDDAPAYRFARPTVEWLAALGSERRHLDEGRAAGDGAGGGAGEAAAAGAGAAGAAGGAGAGGAADLARLRERLFRRPAEPVPGPAGESGGAPDGSVVIVSAPSDLAEVEEAARRVIGLAAEGVPFHEMAVLYRQPDPYARLVSEVFDAAGIPYYQSGGPGLDETPAGRGLRLFLDLAGGGFSRPDVLEWLHAAPLDRSRFGAEGIDPSRWDDLTAEARIVRGRDQWASGLDALFRGRWRRAVAAREIVPLGPPAAAASAAASAGSPGSPEEDLAAVEALRRILDALFRAADAFPPRGRWSGYAAAAVRFLEETFLAGPDRDAVAAALDGLAALDAVEEAVDLDTFRAAAGEALARPRRRGRFQGGGVNVLDVFSARGLRFRAVIVLGLAEKSFPAPARQDPLLLDAEREALAAGGWDLGRKGSRPLEEALLFTLMVRAAGERLVLTFPRTEAGGGRERLPSSHLLRAAEALADRPCGHGDLGRLPWLIRIPAGALPPPGALSPSGDAAALCESDLVVAALAGAADAAAGVAEAGAGSGAGAAASALERAWPAFARGRAARSARRSAALTAYDGLLGPAARAALSALRPPDAPASATHLEAYARCPFRYLLEREMGVGPREEPEEALRLTPRDRGELIHEILKRFYGDLLEDGLLPLDSRDAARAAEARRRLGAVREAAFREWEERGRTGHPTLWAVDRREIADALDAFLDRELSEAVDGFVPRHLELPFGAGNGCDPDRRVDLDLGDGLRVALEGRIDRIDVRPDAGGAGVRARVLDYKTGRVEAGDDRLHGGEALQLPVYLLAAAGITGSELAGLEARYLPVDTAGRRPVAFRGAHLEAIRPVFDELLRTIVGGIRAGRFFPHPGDHCGTCGVKPACSHGVEALWARKAGDPAAAAFLAMKGVE